MKRRAAGLLIQRLDTKQILLLLRSNDGLWGLPGGKVDGIESDIDAALREGTEELGELPRIQVIGERRTRSGDLVYTTYLAIIHGAAAKNWQPTLNEEHVTWEWFLPKNLPANTHPGILKIL